MVNFLQWKNGFGRARLPFVRRALLLFIFAFAGGKAWAIPKFEASLDRSTINLGETVTLSLSCEGGSPNGQPNLPPISDMQFGATGFSQQSFFDGANASFKAIYTYELHPTKVGEYVIPAIKVELNGTRLTSTPLRLKVLKGNAPQANNGIAEPAFVKINVPKRDVYLGEVMPIEIQCYCQNATQVQIPQLAADGFLVSNIPDRWNQQTKVTISNAVFNLLIFRVTATPTRTANATLGPATWSLTVLTGQPDFFGRWPESHRANVTSDSPEIHVHPVPTENAPANFNGALGRFSLAAYEAGPTTVAVGDPITLKIRINGRGSFDTLTLPSNPTEWREFKLYPPTSKLETTDPMQIEGAKYFEQVITPQNAEVKEIPAFALSFFDPDQKAFRTLTHAAIPLSVRPTVATPQPTIISTGAPPAEAQVNTQEIVHIKTQPGTISTATVPLIQQKGFLALQAIAPALWIFSLVWRRQKEKLANNPRLRRQREVARIVEEGLRQLIHQSQNNKAEEFYATIFRLLQEQIGERLDLPASAITEASLETLHANGLSDETLKLLRELFHICNQHRYAPAKTNQELASLLPKIQTALDALQKIDTTKISGVKKFVQTVGCLFLLFTGGNIFASDISAAFNDANKLYEQGKYSEAAASYEKLIHDGSVSMPLYFNLGNAHFKAGQPGRAIYAFRQAEKISPRDADVRANLQFARNQVGGGTPALPGSRWTRWLEKFTLNEWTIFASVVAASFFLLLAVRQLWPDFKKTSSGLTTMLGAASVILIVCLAVAAENQLRTRSSVVIVPEAVLRRGPFDESQSTFTIRDGTELLVLDQKNDWLEVRDARNHTGWLPQKQVALVSAQ